MTNAQYEEIKNASELEGLKLPELKKFNEVRGLGLDLEKLKGKKAGEKALKAVLQEAITTDVIENDIDFEVEESEEDPNKKPANKKASGKKLEYDPANMVAPPEYNAKDGRPGYKMLEGLGVISLRSYGVALEVGSRFIMDYSELDPKATIQENLKVVVAHGSDSTKNQHLDLAAVLKMPIAEFTESVEDPLNPGYFLINVNKAKTVSEYVFENKTFLPKAITVVQRPVSPSTQSYFKTTKDRDGDAVALIKEGYKLNGIDHSGESFPMVYPKKARGNYVPDHTIAEGFGTYTRIMVQVEV
jgi:hypothetical protein